jgi:glycosyltransferase involved in cell wall biosynthesis
VTGKTKELLIIIPAHNEEKNIACLLKQLDEPQIAQIADVLVMNDASTDHTKDIIKQSGHTWITHIFNLGYGSALQLGYKYAIRRGYRYVIQMDADGQHDVCNIKPLYEALKKADENGKYPDIVLGSRFVEGSTSFPIPAVKKLALNWFRMLIHLMTGRWISDPTSGLQGLSRRCVLHYSKYGQFDDKYPDANMILQMLLLGYRVEEIPAVMHPRTEGKSMHSGLKPFVYMFRMTFSIFSIWIRIRLLKTDSGEEE